jgi:hypothetical protein
MPIKARCPECGRVYNLGDDRAGQSLECKECGATFDVPGAPADRRREDRDRPRRRDDREDDRPARKKPEAKGSMLPWLLIGGGALLLLLLCGGGVTAVVLIIRHNKEDILAELDAGEPTKENFARVKRGMSEDEVIRLMGPASGKQGEFQFVDELKRNGVDPARTKSLVWEGEKGNRMAGREQFCVALVDGKVQIAAGTDGVDHVWPLWQEQAANVHKIQAGMTEEQVIDLLGYPAVNLLMNVQGQRLNRLNYRGPGAEFVTVATRDKVVVGIEGIVDGKGVRLPKK